MDINEIAERVKSNQPVSDTERAYLIANDPYALAAWMVTNNPGNLNFQLRNMGYTHLGFEPNKDAIARQLTLLIQQNDKPTLDEIWKNFNPLASESQEFWTAFQQYMS